MSDFDLLADSEESIEDDEPLKSFVENLSNVDRLWRITDLREPNFFKLKPRDRGKISLMDMLKEFIDDNKDISDFDLFFRYMVEHKLKRKFPEHQDILLNLNSVYLKIDLLIQTIRSTPDFLKKLSYIKISLGQEHKPYCQHWDMEYTDTTYDQDRDLINMLERCCVKNESMPTTTLEYIAYIYGLTIIENKQVA